MTNLRTLALLGTTAILTALLATACGGGGSSGPFDSAGTYTLSYNKVGGSDTCGTAQNPTWVQGVMLVAQNGADLNFDFGSGYQVPGSVDGGGNYEFEGDLTDNDGLLRVRGAGKFSSSDVQSSEGEEGIRAEYDLDDDGAADCVTYGTYSGNRLVTTSGITVGG